jgi:hypothetical protein
MYTIWKELHNDYAAHEESLVDVILLTSSAHCSS